MLKNASLLIVQATLLFSFARVSHASNINTISWFPCLENATFPITCGTLDVPLDYSDAESGKTLTLDLVKVNATKEPCLGSILYNPGGPGEGGRAVLLAGAQSFLVASGEQYDVISWDPRGTGQTLPYSCYPDETNRIVAEAVTPHTADYSNVALGTAWADLTTLADNCASNLQSIGDLVGTGYVAQDVMHIVDALGGDGLLRYWGFSYGTLLGTTLAAMYPDRIARMVLDGVVNVYEYYDGTNLAETTQTDSVLEGFFEGCLATPESCALAQPGVTAQDLSKEFYTQLEQLKSNPIALTGDITQLISYDSLTSNIFNSLYSPVVDWSTLAGLLDALFTSNATAALDYGAALLSSPPSYFPTDSPEAAAGIQCSDTTLRTDNLTDIVPLVDELQATSRIAGSGAAVLGPLTCARWRFQAKGQYNGSFTGIKTYHPALLVGSPHDPITPLVSAFNTSAGLEDSVVLQHNGYGHTSNGQPSLCTIDAVRAYFINGTLPTAGLQCEPSIPLFTNLTTGSIYDESAATLKRGADAPQKAGITAALFGLARSRLGRRRN